MINLSIIYCTAGDESEIISLYGEAIKINQQLNQSTALKTIVKELYELKKITKLSFSSLVIPILKAGDPLKSNKGSRIFPNCFLILVFVIVLKTGMTTLVWGLLMSI